MSYTVTTAVYQTKTSAWFEIVEGTVFYDGNGGTWTEANGKHVLTMGSSGTSGIIRFNCQDEYFHVALGVDNYSCWLDVGTNLAPSNTAVYMHPLYYTAGTEQTTVRENHLTSFEATTDRGTKINVNYTVTEGHNLECTIVIS